jgi:ComF family protein
MVAAQVRRWGRGIVDVLLPHQCLRCHALVESAGILCADCWAQLRFVDGPMCAVCGVPFDFDAGSGAHCGECLRERPAYDRARAALVYDDASRPLILAFKNGDRTDAAPAFGRWMVHAGTDLLAAAEVITVVPLHWTRLLARKYNQAALLAHAIGRIAGLPVAPDVLVRRRRTAKLGTLGPAARRAAVRGAVGAHSRRARRIADRRVLLVDDVHTTGATLAACTRALLDAGAAGVDVLTLARTVRSGG